MLFEIPIPSNANYIAQSENGEWRWFEALPQIEWPTWYKDGYWIDKYPYIVNNICTNDVYKYPPQYYTETISDGFLCNGIPPDDFTTELYKVIR